MFMTFYAKEYNIPQMQLRNKLMKQLNI